MVPPDAHIQRVVHEQAVKADEGDEEIETYDVASPDALGHKGTVVVVVLNADLTFLAVLHRFGDEMHAGVAVSMRICSRNTLFFCCSHIFRACKLPGPKELSTGIGWALPQQTKRLHFDVIYSQYSPG